MGKRPAWIKPAGKRPEVKRPSTSHPAMTFSRRTLHRGKDVTGVYNFLLRITPHRQPFHLNIEVFFVGLSRGGGAVEQLGGTYDHTGGGCLDLTLLSQVIKSGMILTSVAGRWLILQDNAFNKVKHLLSLLQGLPTGFFFFITKATPLLQYLGLQAGKKYFSMLFFALFLLVAIGRLLELQQLCSAYLHDYAYVTSISISQTKIHKKT